MLSGRATVILVSMLLLPAEGLDAAPADRWRSSITEASLRFEIPADWIRRVMVIESGARDRLHARPTISPAGAMGLMQLMPGTWRAMRLALGLGPDPFEPHDNILAGALYLRILYDRFGYPGLFAAYNAGPGRYAEFVSGIRRLPAETRYYVAAATGRPARRAAVRPPPAGLWPETDNPAAARPSDSRAMSSPALFVRLADAPATGDP